MGDRVNAARNAQKQHNYRQGLHPPQQRHQAWLARGDVQLLSSERAPIVDHVGRPYISQREAGQHRPGTLGRVAASFATRRHPGSNGAHDFTQPMQRYDTTNVPRHAWLHSNSTRVPKVWGNTADKVLGEDTNSPQPTPMPKRSLLTTLPPEALAAVTQFLDLPALARVEVTAPGWRPTLATAVHAWVRRDYGPLRASQATPHFGVYAVNTGHNFHSSGGSGIGSSNRRNFVRGTETWARVLRFVIQIEARCMSNDGLLATGADARHSLVITPSGSTHRNIATTAGDGASGRINVGGNARSVRGSGGRGSPSGGEGSVRALQSFGWGLFGQTGMGQFEPQTLPAYVEPFAPPSSANSCSSSSQAHLFSSRAPSSAPPRVVQASCGATHSLAVDDDGTCWTWGEDAGRFTCRPAASAGGVGTTTALPRISRPQPVGRSSGSSPGGGVRPGGRLGGGLGHGFGSVRVVAVAAGARFSLCLDDRGHVWSWGSAAWGCLGHGSSSNNRSGMSRTALDGRGGGGIDSSGSMPRDEPSPRRIELLGDAGTTSHEAHSHHSSLTKSSMEPNESLGAAQSRAFVVKIACGPRHCLAVDSQGKLWSWGCNREGALGTGDFRSRDVPTLVWPQPSSFLSPAYATINAPHATMTAGRAPHRSFGSGGGAVSGLVSSSWGHDVEKTLTNDSASQQPTGFQEAEISGRGSEEKVTSVAAGGAHTLVVTAAGRLLTCGANHCGQLGRPAPPSIAPTANAATSAADASQTSVNFSQTTRAAGPDVLPGHLGPSSNSNCNCQRRGNSSTSSGNRRVPKHLQVTPAWAPGSSSTGCSSGVSSGVDLESDAFLRAVECSPDNGGFRGEVPKQATETRGGDALNLAQMLLHGRESLSAATSAEAAGCSAADRFSGRSVKHSHNSSSSGGGWVSAAGGGAHSVAIQADGSCWVWGCNARGQLGIGDYYSGRLPGAGHPSQAAASGAGNGTGAGDVVSTGNTGGRGGSGVVHSSHPRPSFAGPTVLSSSSSSASSSFSPSQTVLGPVGGLPLRPNVHQPLLVTALRCVPVVQVACGANHTLFLAEAPETYQGAAAAETVAVVTNGQSVTGARKSGAGGTRAAYAPPRVFSCGEGGQGQLGVVHPHFGDVGSCDDHALPSPVDLLHPRPREAPFAEAPQALPSQVQCQLASLHVGLAAKPKPEDHGRLRYV